MSKTPKSRKIPKPKSGLYKVVKFVLTYPLRFLCNMRVRGTENAPTADQGAYLVIANHRTWADPIYLCCVLKHGQPHFMAKKELFRIPLLNLLIRALGAYPVNRGGADVGAIKLTIAFLESGEMVGIFPQGTRHPGVNPATTPIKGGVGMITWHTKATVLPVCIATKHNRVRPFSPTKLIIGKPIPFEEFGYENGGRKEYLTASERIFSDICRLGGFDRALPEASSSDEVTE